MGAPNRRKVLTFPATLLDALPGNITRSTARLVLTKPLSSGPTAMRTKRPT